MDKIDIVIQGPFFNAIIDNTKRFIELDFVNKVIISAWEDTVIEDDIIDDDRVILLKNKYPKIFGGGNLNLQLISSLNGIKKAETDIVVKTRSDQQIPNDSFQRLYNFYNEHKDDDTIKYLDGTKQKSKIFITGNGSHWPYHPQDHIFWGYKQDIIKVSNTFSLVGLMVLTAYSLILFSLKILATSLAFSICSILVVLLITLNCVFILFSFSC